METCTQLSLFPTMTINISHPQFDLGLYWSHGCPFTKAIPLKAIFLVRLPFYKGHVESKTITIKQLYQTILADTI